MMFVFSHTWTCSPRTAESPSNGSAGGVFIVTDFSERLSLLRDLWRSRLRSLENKPKAKMIICFEQMLKQRTTGTGLENKKSQRATAATQKPTSRDWCIISLFVLFYSKRVCKNLKTSLLKKTNRSAYMNILYIQRDQGQCESRHSDRPE